MASAQAIAEETRYIRDTLYVELRSGQSLQHRIVHRGLISGTAVKLLEEADDGKYALVKTDDGIEGWIQTQYLVSEPVAKQKLQAANAQLAKLRQEHASLEQQFIALQQKRQATASKAAQLDDSNSALKQELEKIKAVSANALQLDRDVKKLRLNNEELRNQVEILSADNQRLSDDNSNDAFMNGAFAVLIGVFITLIVPRLWPSKSNEWA
jgi:SH3 domain protein